MRIKHLLEQRHMIIESSGDVAATRMAILSAVDMDWVSSALDILRSPKLEEPRRKCLL